ncbi:MAG: hypothetical protein VKK59_02905 [Vampirovibrionales bacterium]|nr:hypothetical protein [Vampirovibrionales bacterium]
MPSAQIHEDAVFMVWLTTTPGAPYALQQPRQALGCPSSYQQIEALLSQGWPERLQTLGYSPSNGNLFGCQSGEVGGIGVNPGGCNAFGYPNSSQGYLSSFSYGGQGAPTNTDLITAASCAIENLTNLLYGHIG